MNGSISKGRRIAARNRTSWLLLLVAALSVSATLVCWSCQRRLGWQRVSVAGDDVASVARKTVPPDDTLRRLTLQEKWHEFPKKLFSYLPLAADKPHRSSFAVEQAVSVEHAEDGAAGVCLTCYSTLSWHPRVLHFKNLLSQDEASHLIELGEQSLIRSGVVHKTQKIHTARTSFGTRLSYSDPIALRVSNRLLAIVNHFARDKAQRTFRAGNAEKLELLRYEGDQEYHGHFDNFGGIDGPVMRAKRKKKRQQAQTNFSSSSPPQVVLDRAATFIVFLNNMSDVADGGHTTFPFSASGFDEQDPQLSDDNSIVNLKRWQKQLERFQTATGDSCDNDLEASVKKKKKQAFGESITNHSNAAVDDFSSVSPFLKIRPVVGTGVLFYDLYENGVADPFSLHSGCPPVSRSTLLKLNSSGNLDRGLVRKYVITKWFMIPLQV